MSRFTVTLPSNSSMDYYDGNTVANFTTKLAHSIELDGKWEVGLLTISVPAEVENVIRGDCYYKVYYNNRLRWTVVMQPGYYQRIPAVVDELHAAQVREIERETGSETQPLVRFIINRTTKTIKMVVPEVAKEHIHVEFSIDLAYMLGFKAGVKYAGTDDLTGEKKFDLMSNLNTFYVYCDVVEPCLVGDTKVPLLRIVDKTEKTTGTSYRTFNPLQYVPVQKKCFDTIEIKLATDAGVLVPFFPGKCVVVLEFRRTAHDYFLL